MIFARMVNGITHVGSNEEAILRFGFFKSNTEEYLINLVTTQVYKYLGT